MTTPTNPQDRATRSAWDRSGCREPVCWCHDDSPIALRQGFACSGCGCRVLNGTDYSKAATQPTGSPAARTPEDEPKANPPASAQGASVERVGRPFRPSGVQAGKPWIDCCDGARDVLLVQDGNGHRLAFRLADILANCQPI